MAEEHFPLGLEDEAEIVAKVYAAEAIERVDGGLEFADLIEDPVFLSRTANLVTPEMKAAGEPSDEKVSKIHDTVEQIKRVYIAQGYSKREASRRAVGDLLKAFVQVQIEKEEGSK